MRLYMASSQLWCMALGLGLSGFKCWDWNKNSKGERANLNITRIGGEAHGEETERRREELTQRTVRAKDESKSKIQGFGVQPLKNEIGELKSGRTSLKEGVCSFRLGSVIRSQRCKLHLSITTESSLTYTQPSWVVEKYCDRRTVGAAFQFIVYFQFKLINAASFFHFFFFSLLFFSSFSFLYRDVKHHCSGQWTDPREKHTLSQ